MRNKILDGISFFGSIASIISLLFVESEWNIAKIFLLILLMVVSGVSFYLFIIKKNTKVYISEEEIKLFMKEWIGTHGIVKVFSRDLSWADEEVIGIFAKKGKDLVIYAEKMNETIKKIMALNSECKVIFYGHDKFVPNSRFTIIHANKEDRQLAIALKEKRNRKKLEHEIYITKENPYDKKMEGLAMDLLNYIECTHDEEKYGTSARRNNN